MATASTNDAQFLLWLASQEGLRLEPYKDPDGKQWNIGFGHFLKKGSEPPQVDDISVEEAWRLLRKDWEASKRYASRALERVGFKPKNPATEKALALLTFNTGPGILRSKNFERAARRGELPLLKWMRSINTVNGVPDQTLTRRRDAEFQWALNPDKNSLPIRDEVIERFKPLAIAGPSPTPTPVPEEPMPGEAPGNRMSDADVGGDLEDKGALARFGDALEKYKTKKEAVGDDPWPSWVPEIARNALRELGEAIIPQTGRGTGEAPETIPGDDEAPSAVPPPKPEGSFGTPTPTPGPSRRSQAPRETVTPAGELERATRGMVDEPDYADVATPTPGPREPDLDRIGREWVRELRRRAEEAGSEYGRLKRKLLRRAGAID